MITCHESEKLNALCGKKVKIIFFDGDYCVGILHKDTLATRMQETGSKNYDNKNVIGYYLERDIDIHFKKSHVKSIKEV